MNWRDTEEMEDELWTQKSWWKNWGDTEEWVDELGTQKSRQINWGDAEKQVAKSGQLVDVLGRHRRAGG